MSTDECNDLLVRVLNERDLTFIVVDALDECNKETRQDIVQAFERLLQDTSSLVKIFVTSRDDLDLIHAMNAYLDVRISAADNHNDISRYIRHSLDDCIRTQKLLPTQKVSDELRVQIEQSLIEKAQGM